MSVLPPSNAVLKTTVITDPKSTANSSSTAQKVQTRILITETSPGNFRYYAQFLDTNRSFLWYKLPDKWQTINDDYWWSLEDATTEVNKYLHVQTHEVIDYPDPEVDKFLQQRFEKPQNKDEDRDE